MESNAIQSIYKILRRTTIYRLNCGGLIDAELLAYDAGFIVLEDKLREIVEEYYIQFVSEVGLRRHEVLLGIELDEGASLAERKKRIRDWRGAFSCAGDKKELESLIKKMGIVATITEDYNSSTATINISKINDPRLTMEKILYNFSRLLPAHLRCNVVYGGITYAVS